MSPNSYERAAELLGLALVNLSEVISDLRTAEAGLAALGWAPPPGFDLTKLALDTSDLAAKLDVVIESTVDERADDSVMIRRYADLALAVDAFVRQIDIFANELPLKLAAVGEYATKTDIAAQLPRRLLDYVVVCGTQLQSPLLASLLHLVGVFRTQHFPQDDANYQVDHERAIVVSEQLPLLVSNPRDAFKNLYGWGTPAFDAESLINNAGLVLRALGARVSLIDMPERTQELIGEPSTGTDSAPTPQVIVDLLHLPGEVPIDAMLSLHRLRPTIAGGTDAGLEVAPYLRGAADLQIPLTDVLRLLIATEINIEDGIALALRPTGVELRSGLLAGGFAVVEGNLAMGLELAPKSDANRRPLLSGPEGIAITADSAIFEVGVHEVAGKAPDAYIRAALSGGRLELNRHDGDGFLQHVLPETIKVDFDLGLRWSKHDGLIFEGSGQLDWHLPLHIAVGPISFQDLHIRISEADSHINLEAAVTAALALGPVSASIQDVGARAQIAAKRGNLGPLDLTIGFRPPHGVGLKIDAPAVAGGGFLLFDEDAGRYAGVFELTIVNTISVKAIGLITTKMPDGSAGFALLILITAEGFTPIQLGMGFSLTGIGGLLALNHTVEAHAVADGLRNGVLDSILFVKDPVKNANRILGTLDQVFPVARDRFLIGPLAEISWGTPPLVKIRLALLLEIPQPVMVVLLAALSMQLPSAKDPAVEIHVDAIGLLDFSARELALDASLHDSRILKFVLTGDMALRLNWGNTPAFLMSMGGFHPKFTPPKGIRPLNRLALALSGADNPRVRFEAYLAVTSNTIQMGARVDIHAEEAGFGIDAGGSFDGLIQWSPFAIDVGFAAWAKVTAGGSSLLAIALALEATGPQPWHITGQASIQVLFFQAHVGVDLTIGEAPTVIEPVELVDVGAQLWAELSSPASWQAILPAAVSPGVTIAAVRAPSSVTPLVAHPLASVSVRQKIAPLDHRIERVGARLPAGGTQTYSISVTAPIGIDSDTVTDLFAPGQYNTLNDDEKLGASFLPMTSGVALTPTAASTAGHLVAWDFTVETLDIVSLEATAVPAGSAAVSQGTQRAPVSA